LRRAEPALAPWANPAHGTSENRQRRHLADAHAAGVHEDFEACYRALSSRDARFDGRFFTGVTSTGIYCRPVCPAQTPRRANVRFYRTAAAAEAAGFRACRRCHPHLAPGVVRHPAVTPSPTALCACWPRAPAMERAAWRPSPSGWR